MTVLLSACTSSSKKAEQALAQALNPQTPRSEDPSSTIFRLPEDTVVKGVAGSNVNLDVNGQPLTVVVRVIQLRDKHEFARLTFDAAASKGDAELFPKELVTAHELVLMPGATQELTDKLLPETRYVAVIGFFRKPDTHYWRFLFDAQAVRKEGLIFAAKECFITPITPQFLPAQGQRLNTTPECAGFVHSNRPRR
ncbi:MAG: type VI secretion system lipoprotein TssJ [Betaproteobacteria bacterium]|nr:type VI secretion system lipoprotein TssJ [Betaproteobacteria bacterium]